MKIIMRACAFCIKFQRECIHKIAFKVAKGGGGNTYNVCMRQTATVAMVKKAYCQVANVHEAFIILTYNGKRLQYHQTLLDCDLVDGDTMGIIIVQHGD